MNYWMLPLATTLSVNIDRIEGEFAVLEWPNEALTSIEYKYLPFSAQEGCLFQLHLYPSPHGVFHAEYENPFSLQRFGSPFVIPMTDILRPGISYWMVFQRIHCGDWK